MQIIKTSKQHVVVIMMLEICLNLTNEFLSGHVSGYIINDHPLDNINTSSSTLYSNPNDSTTIYSNVNDSKTLYSNVNDSKTLYNNMNDSKTLYNNMNNSSTFYNNGNDSTSLYNNGNDSTTLYNNQNDSTTLNGNFDYSSTLISNVNQSIHGLKYVEENCTISRGWNLKGSDWGCCGNYAGCCTFASFICYLHDALCKCCDVGGNFCGPTCKPEITCSSYTADKINGNNCRLKTGNYTDIKHKGQEYSNVDSVELARNHTEKRNGTIGNYFTSGRAVSGTEQIAPEYGGDCVEGSGEIDS